jgi:regulatory protein
MNDQNKPNSRTKQQKPVTAQYLENAALYYLQRFTSSSANLRQEGAAMVEALIGRYLRSGLLDDKAYAEVKAASLHRGGTSTRGIRGKLAMKGLEADHIDAALKTVDEETPGDTELAAAVAFAHRRRLGPFRTAGRVEHRDKDLAALGRVGFSYQMAKRVVDAEDPDSIEDTN